MKILRKGRLPKPWVGRIGVCTNCKCQVRLEEKDRKVEIIGDDYVVDCPTRNCGTSILIKV